MPVAAQPRATFILDNGAYTIKAGYATAEAPSLIPNCLARSRDRRVYIGDEFLTQCKDFSGVVFRRPFEKGHLTNWESEKVIWDRVLLSPEVGFNVDPEETALIATEPVLQLPVCSSNMDQIVFEEYGFNTYYRCTTSALVHENETGLLFGGSGRSDTSLIIDSGYSATSIVPIVDNTVYHPALRRLNVGGKLLRNFLKETISFRHYNMMDEALIINEIKDQSCFVTASFAKDLETCKRLPAARNPLALDYVLPRATASGIRQGHIRDMTLPPDPDDQILTLGNERFSVPELLFNPSDIGIRQAGLPEAIMQSISAVPDPDVRGLLLGNVVFVGGNTKFSGFRERISSELQALVPDNISLRLGFPEDPITYGWQGGMQLSQQKSRLRSRQVTRKEYMEHGPNICMRKFGKKTVNVLEYNT
ncbi:actin family [Lipomyces chichibuensis]|uniref:actin family n=1 Tax=Lipomyces chichibuensis TaxID=1546026 RepID=UPI003343A9D2